MSSLELEFNVATKTAESECDDHGISYGKWIVFKSHQILAWNKLTRQIATSLKIKKVEIRDHWADKTLKFKKKHYLS